MDTEVSTRFDEIAREAFGFEELRAAQREAVAAVADGRDTLVVMPTGSGRSTCASAPSSRSSGGRRCSR